MTELCRQASILIRDNASNVLVGACLANLLESITRPENQYANIAMMGVRPKYRQKGIATRMVQNTLSTFHEHYPMLKFGVAAGSSAESFYYSLGFLPGPVHYVLLIPPTADRMTSSPDS
jgi:predicted GNAT family N-acyltransferase